MPAHIEIRGLTGMPEVREGDDLALLILGAAGSSGRVGPRDVVVVAQKAVSKAEGAVVALGAVTPTAEAVRVAGQAGKDPRLVEVVLRQSRRIIRIGSGVLIVETHQGLVCANAGVDASNVPGDGFVTLLPKDPDSSARCIREGLEAAAGAPVGVIISDTFNRPWRQGSMNVAIGVSGLAPLRDMRGEEDDHERVLHATVVSLADGLAAAAQLAMGETGGTPAAIVRGVSFRPSEEGSGKLARARQRDLFQ